VSLPDPVQENPSAGSDCCFLCSTLYHMLLSSCIASQENLYSTRMLVLTDPHIAIPIYRAFSNVVPALQGIHLVPKVTAPRLPLLYSFSQLRQLLALRHFFKSQRFSRLFVFNDQNVAPQMAMHFACQANPNATFIYVEDGLGIYRRSWHDVKRNRTKQVFAQLLFRFRWDQANAPGGTSWINGVYATFPNLVTERLKSRVPRRILPPSPELMDRLEAEIFRSAPDLIPLRSVSVIVALAYPASLGSLEAYATEMRTFLSACEELRIPVLVKYHPRDRSDYMSCEYSEYVHFVRRDIPFELLVWMNRNSLWCACGDLTTALFSTKWILPKIRTYSVARIFDIRNAEVELALEASGCEFVQSIAQLVDLIRASCFGADSDVTGPQQGRRNAGG